VNAKRPIVRRPYALSDELKNSLHPVLARVYAARHVSRNDELNHSLDRLLMPTQLKGMNEAVSLLHEAIQRDEKILIVGDYDADGATSCAVIVRALRLMGHANVAYVVPNRFEYGYGLTPPIVEVAAGFNPKLLVTVDNGISSVEGVAAARARGMRVVITDHHLPGATLPAADAIVNPNQPGDASHANHLAGVGVAFYLMLALRARLREQKWFESKEISEPNLARLLDLVALGTVADLAFLDHNNRILVSQGLARINQHQACEGIKALLTVSGRAPGRIGATDLGFGAGPRLNAAGRLEDITLGIECLVTDDPQKALTLAKELDQLNRERRAIESQMQQQALGVIEMQHLERSTLPAGLCLFDESWHQGVVGLVASRIKDKVHRPVIAFAPGGDGELKGSARSIPKLHIRDTLDAIATQYPKLLTKFGGHAMAAGLSLPKENFEAFRDAFEQAVARQVSPEDLSGTLLSDGELRPEEFSLELAELLHAGGPWGQGFPEPRFDGEFEITQHRVVGERHLKMNLKPKGGGKPVDAIAFGMGAVADRLNVRSVRALYRLDVNEYQGNRTLQLMVEHLE
jgi:single-stranded-DNA-specific exonuclease